MQREKSGKSGSIPLFFIVGRGRSGTSLLGFILNAHPDIAVTPENQFVINLRNKYQNMKVCPSTLKSFYADLWLEDRFKTWNLNKEVLLRELLGMGNGSGFSDWCKKVYETAALDSDGKAVKLIGDKNPIHSLFLRELIALFPESKFIHIIRDYRDNILSFQKVKFDSNHTGTLSFRWIFYNKEIEKYNDRFPEKFIRIRFEDLIGDPQKTLTNLCRFLGVPFEPAILHYYESAGSRIVPWQKNLTKPLDKNRVYSWKGNMPAMDLKTAEWICGSFGAKFGYKKTTDHPTWLEKSRVLPGLWLGILASFLESFLLFRLPLQIRSRAIRYYRIATGSLQKDETY